MKLVLLLMAVVIVLGVVVIMAAVAQGQAGMSRIKSDERVVLFPTAASMNEDGRSWTVPIHGWIFEPEERDLWRTPLVRTLREAVDLTATEPVPKVFEERVRLFLVDNERGKRIGVRIAGEEHILPPSRPGGHFGGELTLPADAIAQSLVDGKVPTEAITGAGERRNFSGVAFCLAAEGISVVSDIDDTIKVSDVRNRRELLRNTFLREFRAVRGMADAYRKWADAGASFHYVSSSPWQLYEPLAAFMNAEGFPAGTFHLKPFRAKDSTALDLFADPMSHKFAVIEQLMKRFPKRTFVLVGDSAEKDSEIYGRLARQFPAQIKHIYIRDVTDEPNAAPRYLDAFKDVPAAKWQIFKDPKMLKFHEPAASR